MVHSDWEDGVKGTDVLSRLSRLDLPYVYYFVYNYLICFSLYLSTIESLLTFYILINVTQKINMSLCHVLNLNTPFIDENKKSLKIIINGILIDVFTSTGYIELTLSYLY